MKTEQAKTYMEIEVQEMIAKAIKQDREFQAQVLRALPIPSTDVRQGWIENPKALTNGLRELLVPPVADTGILVDWQKFYSDKFGITLDTASIRVPERRKGFDRPLWAQGVTIQQIYDKCAEHFPCWKYTDRNLDEAVPTNDRDPKNGSYAVWIRDRVEADEELKNFSANDLKQKNISGITLLERLLFELKYFKETGKHLDIRNVTLCAGSRCSGGGVPGVRWLPGRGRLYVGCRHPAHARDAGVLLRAREVVS